LRLRTFGGLWLEAPDAPTPGPRRLALLAVVAAAGAKGVSRERVIGLLWPDTGEEQARHALSQAIYALRRGAERDLIAGTNQLRLDPSLTSDVGELRTALGAGDLETGARLYSGRFLEGFYLSGAPEFERWVDEERRDLEGEVVRALERLARQADEEGARPDAVRWWQRLTALDPLSARYAAGLMRALAATGDRSGALGRAKLYRETVRRELDAEPDPAIEKLERSLRSTPAVSPAVQQPEPLPPPSAVVPAAPEPTQRHPRRRWQVAAALLAAGALVAFVVRGGGTRDAGALPFLAVGDVRIEGPGDSTAGARVLRDMLATGLGGIAGLQVVANSRLVELMPRGPDPAPGAIGDAARRAGANEIIEGELSAEPAGLVLSLRRVALGRGVVRKGYVVRATDRFALVDSATAAIARDLGLTPPSVTVTQSRTASPAAYALYDEGLRAYFGYDAPAAYRLMRAAFARDSSFGMAAYYVWHLSSIQGEGDLRSRIQPAVEELARNAIERERLLIQLSIAVEAWPTPVAAALAETLTVKYPQDPDGQVLLGQVRQTEGDWAGAATAYERAILLDSTAGALAGPYCRVCRVIALKTTAHIWADSLAAAERTARRLIALRPDDQGPQGSPWNNLIESLFRQGRRAEALDAQVRDVIGTPSPHGLRRDLIRWGDYERADRELIADLASPEVAVREDAWWLLLLSLRDQGRLREADTLIHRWRVPNTTIDVPGGRRPAVDVALLGLERGRPEVSIRAHRENIAALARWEPSANRARNLAWQLALAGTAHAAAGDTAVVRRLADSLEAIGSASLFGGRDARLHHMLRGLVLQREGRHAEAVDAFRRSLYSVSDGYTRTNLMMARSLLALRRPAEAIAILRPAIRGGVDGSNTYVSRTELHEAMAEAFEQAGRRDSAVVHWRAVESAWRRADPGFAERYRRARAAAGEARS
jgi:DNA-binding SARP family transcriptional activator/tetratricopeptide (TPR) repeat protein